MVSVKSSGRRSDCDLQYDADHCDDYARKHQANHANDENGDRFLNEGERNCEVQKAEGAAFRFNNVQTAACGSNDSLGCQLQRSSSTVSANAHIITSQSNAYESINLFDVHIFAERRRERADERSRLDVVGRAEVNERLSQRMRNKMGSRVEEKCASSPTQQRSFK